MATQYEKLVLLIEDVGVKEAGKAFDEARKKIKGAGDAAETAGKKAKGAGTAFKGFRGSTSALTNTTGQLSVQLQDVGVQLQQGTDYVRIFAQQGPQIASIFGPTGAVYGALIAFSALIAGPFIQNLLAGNKALDDARKFIQEYSKNFDELTDAQKAAKIQQVTQQIEILKSAQKDASEEADALGYTIGRMTKQVEDSAIAQKLIGSQLEDNREEYIETTAAVDTLNQKIKEKEDLLDILTGAVEEQTDETKAQKKALDSLVASITEEVAVLGLSNAQRKVREVALAGGNLALQDAIRTQYEYIESFLETKREQKKAKEAAEQFTARVTEQADKIGLTRSEVLRMQAAQQELTKEQKLAVEVAIQLLEKEEKRVKALKHQKTATDELIEAGREFRALVDQEQKDIEAREKNRKKAAQDRIDDENDALADIERALAEEDRMRAERAEREKQYNQMMADDAIRLQNQEDKERLRIASQATDGLLALEDKLLKGKTEKQKLGFRTLVNFSNATRRQNAIQIISDSKVAGAAAQKALAGIPIVGPILGAAAMASIIAGGYTLAAQSLAGRALGGQVRQGESYVVGERGPEVLTMGSGSGRIIPNEQLRGQQPAVSKVANVTFNITANDTAGFDRLIQSRRGQIVSIINQALNERGRPAIV